MTNLFGLHEPGGEHLIRGAGRSGWLVFTEALGADPQDRSGKDFTPWAHDGITAIVRLNNGYEPGGTIPHSSQYPAFGTRCGNYVAASRGASHWIIGNETNLPIERPGGAGGEVITPDLYAQCFRYCREAILAAQAGAQVIVGAPAPWNNQTSYAGNPDGDWVKYLADILAAIGGRCDGISLHTYTHGSEPSKCSDEEMMGAPFAHHHYNFRAYRDFLGVIPAEWRHLPIYITETDQVGAWLDQNTGWVQAAYAEIDAWNRGGGQPIYCLVLYRWPAIDQWVIEGKNGVIADFQAALQHDYSTTGTPAPPTEPSPVPPTEPSPAPPTEPSPEGKQAYCLRPSNLRKTPGLYGKPPDDILAVIEPGAVLPLLAGPTIADDLTWWQMQADQGTGWAAQVDPNGVTLFVLYAQPTAASIGRPPRVGKSKLDPYQPEIEALLANGSTQKYIAERYGTSEANLSRWLKKHNLQRKRG